MTDRVIHKLPLTPDMRARIRREAATRNTTMNAVILGALASYFGEPDTAHASGQAPASVASFVSDLCECGPGYEVPSRVLYEAYRAYAPADDLAAQHASVFGAALRSACPLITSVRARRDGRLTYLYRGIRYLPVT